jgi:ribosomal protein S18 acetylase RimI-like enzyme
MTSLRFGPLDPRHRGRLAEILVATAVFNPDEIGVALELFDETYGGRTIPDGGPVDGGGSRPSDLRLAYEFIGAFNGADGLLGYACFGPTPGTDRTFDLYWIAVHPDAQGSGVGRGLIEQVERRLGDRGGRLLVVETSSREAYGSTRRFYLASGYDEAARIASYYAPADDRLVYTKRLAPTVATATVTHSPPPH